MSTQLDGERETLLAICPKARQDLSAWPLGRGGGSLWCIGSAEVDRYVRIPRQFCQPALTAARLLDGTRTLEQVGNEVARLFPGISTGHVQRLYTLLLSNGLLLYPRPAVFAQSEVRQLSFTVASLPVTRIAAALAKVLKAPVWWLLNLAGLGLIALALWSLWLHPQLLSSHVVLVRDSYALGFLISLAFSSLVVLWHEIAHGVTAIRYRLRPCALHFILYAGVAPLVYLETRGLYTIPLNRRIIIWLAGIWGNLCAGATLVVVLAVVPLPSLVQQILWKLIIVNLMFVFTNLSPFMPTDGYFIVCNLLGQFNLRTRLFRYMQAMLHGRRLRSVRLGFFAWLYLLVSLVIIMAATGFWLWWLWNICVELFMRASGPLLNHWIAGLALPTALVLLVTLITVRKRRLLRVQPQTEDTNDSA